MPNSLLALSYPSELADVIDTIRGELCASGYGAEFGFTVLPDADDINGWQNGSAYAVIVSIRFLNTGTDPIQITYTTDGATPVTETIFTKTNNGKWRWKHFTLAANAKFGHDLFEDNGFSDFSIKCDSEICLSSVKVKRVADDAEIQWLPQFTNPQSINGDSIQDQTITATQIANATITAQQIANATITATQIANATITGSQIANATITASNIANATITGTQIANASITSSHIVDATIVAGDIANATITGGKIATGTITATNIQAATITATEIANATITGAKIASGTITGANIQDGTILSADIGSATIVSSNIASGTITGGNIASLTIGAGNIQNLTITAGQIANATITGAKIANATITGALIGSATITGSNLAGGTITGSNIAGSTITGANIASATITGSLIDSSTITNSNIANATITGGKIATGTITATNIAAGTITATQIAAGTITADRLNVSTLSAIAANLGTVTAGSISGVSITFGGGKQVLNNNGYSVFVTSGAFDVARAITFVQGASDIIGKVWIAAGNNVGATSTMTIEVSPTVADDGHLQLKVGGVDGGTIVLTTSGRESYFNNDVFFVDQPIMNTGRIEASNRINTTGAYRVDDVQVVEERKTGWGAPTGTAARNTFDTASVTLENLARRVKALIDDLMAHGLIGT